MIWSKSSKEKERYYLLAGMGGAPSRRKKAMFLLWSLVVGIIVSAGLSLILLFTNHLHVD